MTREEIVEYYTHLLASREKYEMNAPTVTSGGDFVKDTITDLIESVIKVLTPQLDENGLALCGCGNVAKYVIEYKWCRVYCTGCDIHGGYHSNKEGAADEWNTAMRASE